MKSTIYHPAYVRSAAARVVDIQHSELFGNGKAWRQVLGRELAAYVMHRLAKMEVVRVAEELYRPSHSTIVTMLGRVIMDEQPKHVQIDREWLAGRTYRDLVQQVLDELPVQGETEPKAYLNGERWYPPFTQEWRDAVRAEYEAAYDRIMAAKAIGTGMRRTA
jgi:hypothetical protein